MLVLGSVDLTAQGVGRLPEDFTFWLSLISVICLEKLRDLSLRPMTLFQRPSAFISGCAGHRVTCGALHTP